MKNKVENIIIMLITIFIAISLLTPVLIGAEYVKTVVNQKDFAVKYTVTFSEEEFHFDKTMGYDIVKYKDNGQLCEIGKPMLPIKNIMLALPKGMKATNIKIINMNEKEMPGTYKIIPAQPPKTSYTSMEPLSSVSLDINFYQSNRPYPSRWVKLTGQTDLAGQGIAAITIFPIHYNPSLKTLKLLTSIEFVIEGVNGYICNDYLPDRISGSGREMYQKMAEEMVVNPEDVELHNKYYGHQQLSIDPADYDYVIITNTSWVNAFQPLTNWKTKKGIPANIVTTDWIYNNENYSGSNKEKIRAFIEDAHTNWGTIFFLLGGDTDYIPYHTASYLGDNIPTDTYYSDYDDDWTCEVHVGRASVYQNGTSAGGIANFINKTLTYEKNPPLTNYTKNVSLFGFDLDSVTDGEDCKIDIDDLYIPSNWSVTTVYDNDSGNHEDAVDTAVNDGQNLINHIDHSSQNYMGTGYTNHNWGLTNSEVDAFNNGNKQSIWYSIGCDACAYDYDNCIAEHFVRDTDGGGVAFIGNSRYGWYYVGSDDYASLRYDRYFFRSFFDQNHYKLGDLFSDHKMDAYNSMNQTDYNKYIFTELTLLGDPELPLWKENPSSLVVTHPNKLPIGSSFFTVHVETSGGNNVNNSYVCLWKGDEVYLTGFTDNTGNVTLYPSPTTTGIMNVTVTKQDFLPSEGEAEVIANQPPYQPSNPNPANRSTGISIKANLSWTGGDPDGDPVTYDVYFGDSSSPPKVSSNQTNTTYDPGTMNYNTTYYWKIIAWDSNSVFNESPLWHFTTEKKTNQPPYAPSNPSPSNGSTGVSINANLSWSCGDPDGDPVTYDVYFGDSIPPPKVADNQTNTTFAPETMNSKTKYYWQIIAWDDQGAFTEGPLWEFTTAGHGNHPPIKPDISGPLSGKIGVSYKYIFVTTDIDGDNVSYYIRWGDGQSEEWIGPYTSEEEVTISHTWIIPGSYKISAKAKDTHDAQSDWAMLEITMPKNKTLGSIFNLLEWMFERFPNAFPIMRYLLVL
ncbi:MAG: hypothetical protein JSW60_02680 [Thermoplasmatales archaeon]|nr:MAG: hypothetical protein JSW60_02680 [Thermoplasmatales archaeon]